MQERKCAGLSVLTVIKIVQVLAHAITLSIVLCWQNINLMLFSYITNYIKSWSKSSTLNHQPRSAIQTHQGQIINQMVNQNLH